MKYYAHSAKKGIAAQTYESHVHGVSNLAKQYAKQAGAYAKFDKDSFQQIIKQAAEYHDLGKLDAKNQKVLSGDICSKRLPVNHTDAGAAHWLDDNHCSAFAAAVVQAHHIGYNDFSSEQNKEKFIFRDANIADRVDKQLPKFEAIHNNLLGTKTSETTTVNIKSDRSVFLRMLLSCIADADHTDTAQNYGKYPQADNIVLLRAKERLAKLDTCVELLQKNGEQTERNHLRSVMYHTCRDTNVSAGICTCDSPVGSGKTTSVMANMLMQAQKRGLRRIFVVLPFTNIIRQSVKTYRKMLTLPGENPNDVVAELHHLADFENEDMRHLTPLWRAPIIVTTAVAFFETLASDSPATLRRLHELPGSAIFVDESHASLPVRLLPLAWKWINILTKEWSCYWVLASGSLSRFWEIPEIAKGNQPVPEIVDDKIHNKLSTFEKNRVIYRHDLRPRSSEELAEWITKFPGPRLVILNTVQSAAVLAKLFEQKYGRNCIEHLSTALTPDDRELELERVKSRLSDENDTNWTLIATSCVEAGVDISFRIGFRELGSLMSLLQTAGRINRNGNLKHAEVWSFRIAENDMMKLNPGLREAGRVLKDYFDHDVTIEPQLTTQSIKDEIKMYGLNEKLSKLIVNEEESNFRCVEHDFKVIDSDTRLAVVNEDEAKKLATGKINWHELQNNSIQIAKYKLDELKIPCILDNIYLWNLGYDNFIGYMAGIIKYKKLDGQGLII